MEKIKITRAMWQALSRYALYNKPGQKMWGLISYPSATDINFYDKVSSRVVTELVMLGLLKADQQTKGGLNALRSVQGWYDMVTVEMHHKICCPSCGNVFRYEDRKRRGK